MKKITTGIDIYVPFAEHLGVRTEEQANGRATITLEIREEHLNSWNSAHGGLVMSLLDMAMGMSAKSVDKDAIGATTIESKTNFLRPAIGLVRSSAMAEKIGRSLLYVEGELSDEAGVTLAKATGTFKLRFRDNEKV